MVETSKTNPAEDLLPKTNPAEYQVSDTIWAELRTEIERVTALINSENADSLTPDEVSRVTTLAAQVRNYGVNYNKEITQQAKNYKTRLNAELNNLGYGVIEQYIADRNAQKKEAINNRLNEKLNIFNGIVNDAVANTTHLKDSSIANFVVNSLSSRFPKLNSGAESKAINNWKPVESVVTMSVTAADKVLIENPVLLQLPATSQSMRAITKYLETGDVHEIEDMKSILTKDMGLLQQIALRSRVMTEESTISEITNVLSSDIDAATKLERIQMLLDVRRTL